MPDELFDIKKWKDYANASPEVADLYRGMKKTFESGESSSSKYDKMRKKAVNMRNKSEGVLDKNEDISEITKRNINPSFNFGSDKDTHDVSGDNKVKQMVERTTGYFGGSNNALDQLMSKFFVTAYDFGMFSCRTTNVDEEIEESMTGIPKKDDVNYLYRAEIEYILIGNNKTQKNLESTRNRILGFRAVMNYISSYTIGDINEGINAAQEAATELATPLAGIALAQALRFGFAGIETAADWDLLTKGDKVLVWKKEVNDLSAKDSIEEMMSESDDASETLKSSEASGSSGLKLNYKQYLEVMMLFFIKNTNVLERTANLITLNVNNIKYKPGSGKELSELKYKLQNAYTAVESYCTVSSNFVVMPKGFAQQVVPGNYGQIVSLENNSYKFKVTRSY